MALIRPKQTITRVTPHNANKKVIVPNRVKKAEDVSTAPKEKQP